MPAYSNMIANGIYSKNVVTLDMQTKIGVLVKLHFYN